MGIWIVMSVFMNWTDSYMDCDSYEPDCIRDSWDPMVGIASTMSRSSRQYGDTFTNHIMSEYMIESPGSRSASG